MLFRSRVRSYRPSPLSCRWSVRLPAWWLRGSVSIFFVQPTRGLDIGAIENIHRQIIAERDKGVAILLISLELDEIMELADTIGVIYNGQLLKIADASTMTSHDVGKYMMGVKEA